MPEPQSFVSAGTELAKIDVQISYRIIELFSDGLYTSPNKAVEELVSNAYDAGARHVHVIVPVDLTALDAAIVTIDDGNGMDFDGLRDHWVIGVSTKRDRSYPLGRKPIGKFGIGKLATYVLAKRLTHVTKIGGKYFAASMDYTAIPRGGSVVGGQTISLPFRELEENEARDALSAWTTGDKPGYTEISLFGAGASDSWTVTIMSDLKEKARDLKRGRLAWVLRNAMPIRDDFRLFLNGDELFAAKLDRPVVNSWVFGKDLAAVPKPASTELEVTEDASRPAESPLRYGLTHPKLGRITGYAQLYEDTLTGPSGDERVDRSHGFFVYVLGRLVNIDDEYFGINRNLLRHGTFSRFRAVVNIDALDAELRSSRESVREGELFDIAKNLLQGIFTFVRSAHQRHEEATSPGQQVSNRVASSPSSLAKRPIAAVASAILRGGWRSRYINSRPGLQPEEVDDLIARWSEKADSDGEFVSGVQMVELEQSDGFARFDLDTGQLWINERHPFVAFFLDEYTDRGKNLPLELLAMSEVLIEAHLFESGVDNNTVLEILDTRDQLLRHLARGGGRRNAYFVAQDLLDAATQEHELEIQLVAAFQSMGFEAIPIGTSDKPDGRAEAFMSGLDADGAPRKYAVSLESKSTRTSGKRVSAHTVDVSGIARHRDEYDCEHAVVLAPAFQGGGEETAAIVREIRADRAANTNRTITLVNITDLAKLVRIVPLKRLGLSQIREWLLTCSTAEDSHDWIESLTSTQTASVQYREILETIWELQRDESSHRVTYSSLGTALRLAHEIVIDQEQLVDICRAIARMAPEYCSATQQNVELEQRPDIVFAAIRTAVAVYPDDERPPEFGQLFPLP